MTTTKFDYYDPPTDKIFDEVKTACIKIWNTYDDTYGYATEKTNSIKDIENVGDNTGYMVAMFDSSNQQTLINMVDGETRVWMEQLYEFGQIPIPHEQS